ncbi:ankyrin repeat domain-containing protein 27 [Tachysurus vachellii]|uniref:ankyrin repeat domain-containing protein 27 n=1 Tax=Tachysurus vachellii TaxID=175792 RepID=UPI00296B289D|nr:ankyrin repeat domain-containing protein 27 [Tachysurus vachellii]
MLRPKDLCQGSGTKTFLEAMNSGKVHLARFVLDALDCRIINSKNESSRTPLMCAVCLQEPNTRSKFTQLLLEKGADVNSRDENGRTALSLACELGHLDAVKLLVQFNANPELTDTWGNGALTYAAYGGHSQVLDFLIRAFKRLGLRLDHTNHAGHTPIQVAEYLGHGHCVQVLITAGRKVVSSAEQPHEIQAGSKEAVLWPNRIPQQILEKFSKQVHSKNEEALPSLFQKQMWIGDSKDPKRQFSQQTSPDTTNSNGYQSLTRFPERRFTEKEQQVMFSSKQFQNSREAGFGRKNNLVSERCKKMDQREMGENPPQWGKAKSFNLELQTGRKQSYQGEARDVTPSVSQSKRASLPDERPLIPKFYCHGNTSARKSDACLQPNGAFRVSADQRNSNSVEKKKSSIKRGSAVKNDRPNKLLFIRDELQRERIRIRPPGFSGIGTRLLRRFTAPEFMGLGRDGPSGARVNKGKIARSETFPLSHTHKLVNSHPSVDSISGVRCEFEGSPPISRA